MLLKEYKKLKTFKFLRKQNRFSLIKVSRVYFAMKQLKKGGVGAKLFSIETLLVNFFNITDDIITDIYD